MLVVLKVPPNSKAVVPRNKVIVSAVFQLLWWTLWSPRGQRASSSSATSLTSISGGKWGRLML